MAEYRVRLLGIQDDFERRSLGFVFDGGSTQYGAAIDVSRQVGGLLPRVGVDADQAAMLVGLPELERRFRSGVYPSEDTSQRSVVRLTSDSYDRLVSEANSKVCRWQRRTPPGLVCDATPPGEDARTTGPVCLGCGIPDERLICRHLVHPRVEATGTAGPFDRDPLTALCEIGKEIGDGSACRPGGMECWERMVSTRVEADTEPTPDVAKRAADEVDYFRLVYRDRYHAPVLAGIPQARSIAEFFGECDSEADFTRRVSALADLLGHMTPHDQLPEAERVGANGNKVGSLVALARLMAHDYPEAVADVEALRLIPRARQVFPVHSRTDEVVATMREFGIDYPTTDWNDAWLRVLARFLAALGGVRAAIQSGEPQSASTE